MGIGRAPSGEDREGSDRQFINQILYRVRSGGAAKRHGIAEEEPANAVIRADSAAI